MRFSLRDWISLLGFASLGFSLFSLTTPSLASTRSAARTVVPTHALSSDGMSGGMKPPASLKLNMDGRDIVTIYETGKVQIADELSLDEASHEFWRKVGELAPDFCKTQAAKRTR
jgi:hypothetical protein